MSNPSEIPTNDKGVSEAGAPQRISLRLTNPHPLINRTLQQEEARKRVDYSYVRDYDEVSYRASKKQARFALAILDRLFRRLESEGFEVVLDNPNNSGRGTYARKGRDQCSIRVDEICEQVAHEVTSKEKEDQEHFGSKPPKWDSVPTGQFTLSPGGKVDLRSEDAFSNSLACSIAAITEHVETACKARVAREQREHEEAMERQRQHEYEQRIKAFRESAESLEHYQVLMRYIEEVRRHGVVPKNQLQEGQTLEHWLSWAERQARRFHPLV